MSGILKAHFKSTNVRNKISSPTLFSTTLALLWKTAPRLARFLVKALLFAPVPYQLTAQEERCLAAGNDFQFRVNGRKVAAWTWGEGPGILLLHGWNGRGVQLHRFIEPLVEAGFSMVALDAPGHGASQGKTSSYFEYTDAVRALLRSNRKPRLVGVIAHSLGASAYINAAVKESCELKAVLIAPALQLFEVLYETFDRYYIPTPLYKHLIAEYERHYGYDQTRDNPVNLLNAVKTPLLLFHDRKDAIIPHSHSRMAARLHPNITLHTTTGRGHKDILLDPCVVASVQAYFRPAPISKTTTHVQTPLKGGGIPSNHILSTYRQADFEKRLSLFLKCPTLRSRFVEIDLAD